MRVSFKAGVSASTDQYAPSSFVVATRVPIIAGPLIVTVTPGNIALVLSVTRPSIAPIVALTVCAAATRAVKWATRITAPRELRTTPPPASASNANLQHHLNFTHRLHGHRSSLIDRRRPGSRRASDCRYPYRSQDPARSNETSAARSPRRRDGRSPPT